MADMGGGGIVGDHKSKIKIEAGVGEGDGDDVVADRSFLTGLVATERCWWWRQKKGDKKKKSMKMIKRGGLF